LCHFADIQTARRWLTDTRVFACLIALALAPFHARHIFTRLDLTALSHNSAQLLCAPRCLSPLRLRHAVKSEWGVEICLHRAYSDVVDRRVVHNLCDRRCDRDIAEHVAIGTARNGLLHLAVRPRRSAVGVAAIELVPVANVPSPIAFAVPPAIVTKQGVVARIAKCERQVPRPNPPVRIAIVIEVAEVIVVIRRPHPKVIG
jgi:hypothetical protein